jgi:hypothetical protein
VRVIAAADGSVAAQVTTALMPEYVLPYLLHLLAHFPDFPSGPDDSMRWKAIHKCVTQRLCKGA